MRFSTAAVACGSPLNKALAGIVPCCCLLFTPSASQSQTAPVETYQDFRGKKPLQPFLKFTGPDINETKTFEDEGLRITLPATGRSNQPVGITFTENLVGDFEVTGTYEMLSADKPGKGGGSGVALNIGLRPNMDIFAKVGRVVRVKEGESFVVEGWNRLLQGNNYMQTAFPAHERTGQIRLTREGSAILFRVAEPAGAEFKSIYQRNDFGTEETSVVRFVVNNQGDTAGLSVRLIDFRIRASKIQPADNNVGIDFSKESNGESKGWLAAGLIVGLMITLSIALGLWLFFRRRGPEAVIGKDES